MSKRIKLEHFDFGHKKPTLIKQEETDFNEKDEEEDFIPPDFFDDLLIENVAKNYNEQIEQNQQAENNFTTLQENSSTEIEDNDCENYKKCRFTEEENLPDIFSNKSNSPKCLESDEKVFNSYLSSEISAEQNKEKNFNGSTEFEVKFCSETVHYRNSATAKIEETFSSLDNLDKEIKSEQRYSITKLCDDQKKNFHSANNNLSSFDENYVNERLLYLRKTLRHLRLKISKNPPTNILTKLTYHMAACNNERILLEKYEIQGNPIKPEEYPKCSVKTDNFASMGNTELQKQSLRKNTSKKPYSRKVNTLVKVPVKTYNTTQIYNPCINYGEKYNCNQYYQDDTRSSFYNEDSNYSNNLSYNNTDYLNTYNSFESLDYRTKESHLNRLSDLQNTLRSYVNLPNEQFNSMLSEIIKIRIYLLRYEQELNSKFEMERQFIQ